MNLNNPTELGIGPVPIKIVNPFSAYGLQLSIQQPIFNGFQLSSSRSAAKYNHLAISTEHLRTINNKTLEIHSAFWNLFKTEKSVELLTENLSSLKEHLKQTKDFLNNGLVTVSDYLKLKVQVSNMEIELIDAKNKMEIARASFNKAIGINLAEKSLIETRLNTRDELSLDYGDLFTEALQNREEIKSLDYRIKAGEDQITAANSGWWPILYASGNFYLYNLTAKTFSIDNQKLQLWFVGLSLSWDLWDWGHTSSKSNQAKQTVIQNKVALELLKEQIELEVYNNHLTLQSEKEIIDVSQLAVESAEENLRITKDKYQYQLATSNDLIDAEVELLYAKTKLAIAQANYQLSKVNLELAVGRRIY
jgi:outer membrane protein TolC